MRVRVRFFAILKDRAGTAATDLQLDEGATIQSATAQLSKQFPPISDFLPRVAFAVNQQYVPPTTPLHDGDELALIPPVSGG
jgi:molybdopterin converting factor subunit 1